MGVAVDDARHQRETVGLDDPRRRFAVADARGDAGDPAVDHGHVGVPRRRARAVVQRRAADQEVEHYAVFSSGAANIDSISRRTL